MTRSFNISIAMAEGVFVIKSPVLPSEWADVILPPSNWDMRVDFDLPLLHGGSVPFELLTCALTMDLADNSCTRAFAQREFTGWRTSMGRDFENLEAKTHFDTNHCTTVLWSAGENENFKKQLIATLRRLLNLFPTRRSKIQL